MIYCVEDDKNIRELIVYTLTGSGYEATGCGDAEEFYQRVDPGKAELILLDIMLPGEDGLSILKKIRGQSDLQGVPVIMLTAKNSEYDKVMGLDMGADDYIPKPFGMMEFLARVRALLRRSGGEGVQGKQASDVLSYKEMQLTKSKHKVKVQGEKVELTLKEFKLLEYLLENEDIVLTRDQLLEKVWGYDFNGESRTVDVHVRTLRQKLGGCGEYIRTIRGVGYCIGGEEL